MAQMTAAIAAGRSSAGDVERLRRWAAQIERRGACRHPDGAVQLVRSAWTCSPPTCAGTSTAIRAWPPAARAAWPSPTTAAGWR